MSDPGLEGGEDQVLPFAVEALDVRGRVVRLGPELDALLARHAYPPLVSRTLAEAITLTALLGSALKSEGRFQLQTKSDGPIERVVVDLDRPDRLRAYALFHADRVESAIQSGQTTTGALLGHGHLAMTIEQGAEGARYQGVTALDGTGFESAAHQYFQQSEQIPTRVRLAVAETFMSGEGGRVHYRSGGLLVQFLPASHDRLRQQDLSPGDAPEGYNILQNQEDDAWSETQALLDTVEDLELVDPAVSSERLLYRLFHERGVRVFQTDAFHEACKCSRDRIMAMLRSFSSQDRRDMVGDNGRIGITCEFCSRVYDLDPQEVEQEMALSEG